MKATDIETNYLLTCLSEECGEIIKEACKGIRFGLDSHYPGKIATNAECLLQEFHDLWAIIEILQDQRVIPKYSEESQKFQKEAKKEKILKNYQ